MKLRPLTFCKLHCGCSGVRCLCSFLDRHVLPDTDALPCLSADREIRNDNLQVTVTNHFELRNLLFILLLGSFLSSHAQIDIKRKKIELHPIDTSELFVYETKNAKLRFAQSDILDYFIKMPEKNRAPYQSFIDTLKMNSNIIEVKADTIYDKVYEFDRGNGLIEKGEFPNGKDKRDYLSRTFMFIASDLMLQGKVEPYSKRDKRIFKDYINAKKKEGYFGTEYLDFLLPNKIVIYEIVTALGE